MATPWPRHGHAVATLASTPGALQLTPASHRFLLLATGRRLATESELGWSSVANGASDGCGRL